MTVEVAAHIDELDPATIGNSTDPTEGGAQISQIKQVLKTDFANISGAVTASDTDLNTVDVTTLGTAEASKVLTASATSTIDATTMTWTNLGAVTTVDINGGTVDAVAIGATSASTGAFTTLSTTGLATLASVDINGGAIDGTTVGSTTPAAGAFTTLTASGAVTFTSGAVDGAVVGGTTPAAGTFTTLTATGAVNFDSGAIDGVAIGGTTPAAGAFTTLTAGTSLVLNGSTALTSVTTDLTTPPAAHDTLVTGKAVTDYAESFPHYVVVNANLADISSAETIWMVAPLSGTVIGFYSVLEGAITVADSTVTLKTAADAAMASLVVSYTGSAAGDVDSETTITNATVSAGDALKISTDGLSNTAQRLWLSIIIQAD